MRVGHAGVALAAKRVAPTAPLWLLIAAAYGPDILEVALRVFGLFNRALSHSLIAVGLGATILALGFFSERRDRRAAVAIWVTYVLHWPADYITGTKPTWPGGPWVGLNLYDRPVLVWVVDLGVLAAGALIYATGLRRPSAAPGR
jgi:membrane-bound metal-dependent hydrolase YbcI (DUF457 family)